MTWLVAALGIVVGVVAGLLGAGGSLLTVPLLVYAGGLGIHSAVTTALVVVAVMSLVAVVPYARAGAVDWRAALGFGVASTAGAIIGGRVSTLIPSGALLVLFLLTMLVAGVAMLWERAPATTNKSIAPGRRAAVLAVSGVILGVFTGMVGLGGGFAVVPLLVLFARTPVRSAIGTSILLVAMNTTAGFIGHLPYLAIDWRVATYLSVAESAGSLAGAHLARHVGTKALRRAFAALMLVTALLLLATRSYGAHADHHRPPSPVARTSSGAFIRGRRADASLDAAVVRSLSLDEPTSSSLRDLWTLSPIVGLHPPRIAIPRKTRR